VPDILTQWNARSSPTGSGGQGVWPWGSVYRFDSRGHQVLRIVHGVTEDHVAALHQGECELAVVLEEPLLIVCSRFGEGLPWSAAAFHWQRLPRSTRVLPQEGEPTGIDATLTATLIEATDERIVARRAVSLPPPFARALNEAILEQARFPYDPSHERRALDGLRRRCPGIGGLVANSTIRMKA